MRSRYRRSGPTTVRTQPHAPLPDPLGGFRLVNGRFWEHAPVVRRVGRPQHRADPVVEQSFLCACLTNQVAQGSFVDDRIHDVADLVVGPLHGDLRDPEQDLVLAADSAQVSDQFAFHATIRVGVDLVDEAEEKVNEGIGDFGPSR